MESDILKRHIPLEDASDARYLTSGHLVFLRRGTLMVVPFDQDRLELTGRPVPAVAGVMQALNITTTSYNSAAGQFSVSASGSMAYVPGGILPDNEGSLVWIDQKGNTETIAT